MIRILQGAYIRTFAGRRRYLRHINSNGWSRAQAERQATNTIIQGSAADMVKCALLRIMAGLAADSVLQDQAQWDDTIPEYITPYWTRTTFQHPHVRILMQLHDEILIEAREDLYAHVISIVRNALEGVVRNAAVRFPVNVKVGKSLDQLETIIKASKVKQNAGTIIDLSQYRNTDNTNMNVNSTQSNSSNVAGAISSSQSSDESVLMRTCDRSVVQAMNRFQIDIKHWYM
jgi:hypothetical protein